MQNQIKKTKNTLDLPVFNTLKVVFGEAFANAVEKHTRSAKENIKRIEQALEANNASELEHAAHSIKGASAQFGAMRLSEISLQLEELGKEGKVEEARSLLEELKTAQLEAEQRMLQEVG